MYTKIKHIYKHIFIIYHIIDSCYSTSYNKTNIAQCVAIQYNWLWSKVDRVKVIFIYEWNLQRNLSTSVLQVPVSFKQSSCKTVTCNTSSWVGLLSGLHILTLLSLVVTCVCLHVTLVNHHHAGWPDIEIERRIPTLQNFKIFLKWAYII